MPTGRKFAAKFRDATAREAYLTWSAGQMFIYNESVLEQRLFDSLSRLVAETERHKQPVRKECRIERPKPDQKYAHFIDKAERPWLSQVPSAILGIGAFRFCQASRRAAAGLAARPKLRAIKDADRHLLLTRDYFTIEPSARSGWHELRFGSARIPGGTILFKAHREFIVPAMVSVTLTSKALFVSMSYKEAEEERFPETEKEMIDRLRQYSEEELIACGNGIDRGVVRPVQTSNDPEPYALTKDQLERIRRKERQRKHYQKRMARCEKGSRNRAKMRRKVSRTFDYRKNVINDFAHQTSHALVADAKVQFFVLENLRVKNMTRRPHPKYDDSGKALPNGARAKAGLNRAILSSGWRKTEEYLKYKAVKAGKLVVKVDPAYTSQRCPKCGRVERKNRPTQSVFRCVSCGFESANADYVAAGNILMAGVKMIREGKLEPKKVKATLRGKPARATTKKLGPGRADVMPVEPERCPGTPGCQTRHEAGSPSIEGSGH